MRIKTRHFQRAGMVFGAVVAALLFFLGGAALRLLMGPISLGPFAGAIEDSLNRSITGLVVRFDRAVLEWSRADGNINLIVLGAKVFDVSGRIVAQAPKADLDFDAAAMLAGDFSLKRFSLLGVQLTAVRNEDGTLKLGFGPIQGDADLLKIIRDTLQRSSNEGGSLETFSIRDARLAFRDEASGLFLISPRISFALETVGERFNASLDGAVEISGAPAQLSARVALREDGSAQNGSFTIRGLDFAALVANSDKFAALAPYPIKTDLNARFALAPNGALQDIAFQARGAGTISPPGLNAPLKLDQLTLTGRYDAAGNQIGIESLSVAGPEIEASGAGELRLAWNEGAVSTVTAGLKLQAPKVAPAGFFEAPVAFSDIELQAGYEIPARKVTVQRLDFKGAGLSGHFSGTAEIPEEGSPAITVAGQVQPAAISEVLAYWPVTVARGARQWMQENVREGRVGLATVAARIPAGALNGQALAEDALLVSFPLEGVTAEYMDGLTLLTSARGNARLTGNTFRLETVDGRVGPLLVSNGDVTIPDLHLRNPTGQFKAHVEGRMPEVMTLIDMEPLGYARRFGIAPASTAGQAAIDLDFLIPMRRNLHVEDVRIGVTARVAGLVAPIDAKRRLEEGAVSFAIDNDKLAAEGAARLSGVPVVFKWNEQFAVAEGPTTRVEVEARLDDSSRPPLGLAQPDWVKGPMPMTAVLTGRRFKFDQAAVRADLTAATASVPAINLEKRAGTAAAGTATVHFGPQGALSIADMTVTGTGLAVRGDLALSGAGELTSANFSQVRAGEINDFALAITQGNGQRHWRITGRSIDARPLVGDDDAKTAASAGPPPQEEKDSFFSQAITIDAQLERVPIRDDTTMRDLTLALSLGVDKRINGFSLKAAGPGAAGKLTGKFSEANGVRTMTVEGQSAGDFMRAATGFPSLRNGSALLRIDFPPDAAARNLDYTGLLTLRNFSVVDQPFLARLFSIGSLDGPLRLLQGQGIQFTQLEAPFTSRGGMLNFRDGKASGAAIGFSFQGQIDRDKDTVDLNGSLVPVYGLNSMLGALPVVGNLLVSKEGEGLIAMTYRVRGALDEPGIMVNPLSVLTPGIFRRIFEFGGPRPAANAQAETRKQ